MSQPSIDQCFVCLEQLDYVRGESRANSSTLGTCLCVSEANLSYLWTSQCMRRGVKLTDTN